MKLIKQDEIGVWIKASELKQIDYPLCIRYDGGGAWWYGTVCSMVELQSHISENNPISEIEWLKPIKDVFVLTEQQILYLLIDFHKEQKMGAIKFLETITKQ